jgi:periplasmic divalent cation tolerance protein
MPDSHIVFTTAESREQAQQLAHALVEQQLAACVNIVGPMESVYRWKGKVESANEFLLIIKTIQFARVRDAISKMHSYELPECIAIAIDDGSAEYLKWIAESVKTGS